MDGVAPMADDQRWGCDLATLALGRRDSPEEQSLQYRRGRTRVLGDNVQRHAGVKRQPSPRRAARHPRDGVHRRSGQTEPHKNRRKCNHCCQQRVLKNGHLNHEALDALGKSGGKLQADVGTQRAARRDDRAALRPPRQTTTSNTPPAPQADRTRRGQENPASPPEYRMRLERLRAARASGGRPAVREGAPPSDRRRRPPSTPAGGHGAGRSGECPQEVMVPRTVATHRILAPP